MAIGLVHHTTLKVETLEKEKEVNKMETQAVCSALVVKNMVILQESQCQQERT